MFRYTCCKEVRPINIDAPKLLHSFVGVGYSIVVLCEASRGDEMVYLSMSLDDGGKGVLDRSGIGYIAVVSSHVGNTEDTIFLG